MQVTNSKVIIKTASRVYKGNNNYSTKENPYIVQRTKCGPCKGIIGGGISAYRNED